MVSKLTVVISQGQSDNPQKRGLEQSLATSLADESSVDVITIPHLYDLPPEGTTFSQLRQIPSDFVLISWLFPRAAHWTLDRNQIRGEMGKTELANLDEDDAEEQDDQAASDESSATTVDKLRVQDKRTPNSRTIFCLDLRATHDVDEILAEIRRIVQASGERRDDSAQSPTLLDWLQGQPTEAQVDRFLNPINSLHGDPASALEQTADARETPSRRWYPVIDFSRCTNCMECIDFCLFGVYGVDQAETILVEQPDNCRKGCPACSRVCPENAIIFPQHKTPAIAGSNEAAGSLKIDLSKLFGAPEDGKSALEVAALERDEQLALAGREVVGMSVGMPKRQAARDDSPKDELDSLIDQLDELDV